MVTAVPYRCLQCGANLSIPHDPAALSVSCAYCARENPLPPEVIAHRQRQQREAQAAQQAAQIFQDQRQVAKRASRVGLWITLATVLPAVIIPIVIVLRVTASVDGAMENIPRMPPIPVVTVPATAAATVAPAPRPLADVKPAQDRVRAILKDKDALGCRIMMRASDEAGPQSFTANLSKPTCAVFIAVAAADDEKLSASLTTPLDGNVAGPPDAKELIFPYCPTTNETQPHALKIKPSTDDPYVFAAVDCAHAAAFPKASATNVAAPPRPPPAAPRPVARPRH